MNTKNKSNSSIYESIHSEFINQRENSCCNLNEQDQNVNNKNPFSKGSYQISPPKEEKIKTLNVNQILSEQSQNQDEQSDHENKNEINTKTKEMITYNSEEMKSLKSVSSIESDDYYSARSSFSSNNKYELENNYCNSYYDENDLSSSKLQLEKFIKDKYQEMKNYLKKGEYNQIIKIENEIAENEMEFRKMNYQDKLERLEELEKSARNLKPEDNYIIDDECIDKDEHLVLANIKDDQGYSIVNEDELNKNYDVGEFEGYQFYLKKNKL